MKPVAVTVPVKFAGDAVVVMRFLVVPIIQKRLAPTRPATVAVLNPPLILSLAKYAHRSAAAVIIRTAYFARAAIYLANTAMLARANKEKKRFSNY